MRFSLLDYVFSVLALYKTAAGLRVKVEKNAFKCFKIFSETLCNHTNKKQVDDMMVIVCTLCNLKLKLTNN